MSSSRDLMPIGLAALLSIALLFACVLVVARRVRPARLNQAWEPLIALFPLVLILAAAAITGKYPGWGSYWGEIRRVALFCAGIAVLNSPVVFYYSGRAVAAVPESLKETALLDGASGWQQFRRIFIPLGGLNLLTGLLIAIIQTAAALLILGHCGFGPAGSTALLPSTNLQIGITAASFVLTAVAFLMHRAAENQSARSNAP